MPADLPAAIIDRIDSYPGLAEALGQAGDVLKRFKDGAVPGDVAYPYLVFVNVAGREEFASTFQSIDHTYWDFHVYSASSGEEAAVICNLVRAAFTGWTAEPDDGRIGGCLPTYHRESIDERDGANGVVPVWHHVRTFHILQTRGS